MIEILKNSVLVLDVLADDIAENDFSPKHIKILEREIESLKKALTLLKADDTHSNQMELFPS